MNGPRILIFIFIFLYQFNFSASAKTVSEPKLNPAEEYVLKQVTKGEVANLAERFSEESKRTLTAQFLKRLLTEPSPDMRMKKKGIRIIGARIKDKLDIYDAKIPILVSLTQCTFDEDIIARYINEYGIHVHNNVKNSLWMLVSDLEPL